MPPSDLAISEAVPRGAQSIVDAILAGDFGQALELAEALMRLVTTRATS